MSDALVVGTSGDTKLFCNQPNMVGCPFINIPPSKAWRKGNQRRMVDNKVSLCEVGTPFRCLAT